MRREKQGQLWPLEVLGCVAWVVVSRRRNALFVVVRL